MLHKLSNLVFNLVLLFSFFVVPSGCIWFFFVSASAGNKFLFSKFLTLVPKKFPVPKNCD